MVIKDWVDIVFGWKLRDCWLLCVGGKTGLEGWRLMWLGFYLVLIYGGVAWFLKLTYFFFVLSIFFFSFFSRNFFAFLVYQVFILVLVFSMG